MKFLEKFNIKINDASLIDVALTHSSYSNEHVSENYERLEYLGDAVLQLIVSEYLYKNTSLPEGVMSKTRASYVCEKALVEYEKNIGYKEYIKVGHGQIGHVNDTIVADVFEAILGAIFLDQGLSVAKNYIYEIIIPYIEGGYQFFDDYKTRLQEMVQTEKESVEYRVVNESGPAHDRTFEVDVIIDDIVYGHGIGKSKKEAEQNAAYDAYSKCAK
ncbi:MAG: ribonuclease III [Bacilli bacterium]|nr:ribonuclease III [Bacilli bacterium]